MIRFRYKPAQQHWIPHCWAMTYHIAQHTHIVPTFCVC